MCIMVLNEQCKGVELFFNAKPTAETLNALKTNGFRWHNIKKIWYAKQTEQTIETAKQLAEIKADQAENIATQETIKTTKTAKENKNTILSLWDRVQIEKDLDNIDKKLYGKDIAKIVRDHIKQRFTECKISVTSDYNSVSITIKSSPYDNKKLEYSRDIEPREYRKFEEENNKELNSIVDYCTKYLQSFKYCTCHDPYGDYGSSYNIYTHVSISYDYIQTEQTETIKEDIQNFKQKLIEQTQAEEQQKELQYQEYLKQSKIDEANAKIEAEQNKKDMETINTNTSYSDLTEQEQYMITNIKMANCNKNNTMEEYTEQINEGEFYLKNLKVTREVYFKTLESLELFKNMLLHDFDFISGTGGSYTDDPRINSMTDYNHLTKEEQTAVIFNLEGIAVYFNNDLQFVIDAQGYNYSRYVGITDEANKAEIKQIIIDETIQENKNKAEYISDLSSEIIINNNLKDNWQNNKEYYKLIKNALTENKTELTREIIQQISIESLKIELYKTLTYIDSVQEQFINANITDGDKLTIISISDFGMVSNSKVTFHNYINSTYAQYQDGVKMTFTPYKKRNKYYNYYHSGKSFIIVEGWQEVPDNILFDITERNGMTIRSSKYGSCDRKQLDDIKEYFNKQNIKILIDRIN